MKTMKPVALLLLFFTLAAVAFGQAGPPGNTKNVILITLDGARTQEVFGGLDLEVLKSKTKKGSVEETPLYKKYYAETPEERREKVDALFLGRADEATRLDRREPQPGQRGDDHQQNVVLLSRLFRNSDGPGA